MKIHFEKPKGQRLKSRFWGMGTFGDGDVFWNWSDHHRCWFYHIFDDETDKWIWYDANGNRIEEVGSYGNILHCRSIRAFRRRMKKAPKGVEFYLVNRYIGYDVTATNRIKK